MHVCGDECSDVAGVDGGAVWSAPPPPPDECEILALVASHCSNMVAAWYTEARAMAPSAPLSLSI